MATSLMRIDVATVGTGTNDTSRSDGVPNQLVTLNYVGTGGATFLWRFWDVVGGSTPSITNAATSVATFTPSGGVSGFGQSFGIELVTDGTLISRRTYKIPTAREGLLLPVFSELADPAASLFNNGPAEVTASIDNAGGNYRGWAPNVVSTLQQTDKFLGIFSICPAPHFVSGSAETLIGSVFLNPGTANKIEMEAGTLSSSDQSVLKIYRQSDNTLMTTVTKTGLLGLQSVTNVVIAQAGWYELRGSCSNSAGTALFRGVEFDMR
jgi:hypothetical protein